MSHSASKTSLLTHGFFPSASPGLEDELSPHPDSGGMGMNPPGDEFSLCCSPSIRHSGSPHGISDVINREQSNNSILRNATVAGAVVKAKGVSPW